MNTEGFQSKVLGNIDRNAVLELLSEMVRTPSIAPDDEELAKLLVRRAKELGLPADLYYSSTRGEGGRPSVVIWLKGTGDGCDLMFNGHIDTNPVGMGWEEDPFSGAIRGDYIYGLGVFNMKAGIAAFVHAAKAIMEADVPLKGDLIITAVCGEIGGGIGTRCILDCGIRPDYAIVGEPSDLKIRTLHAGGTDIRFKIIGKSTHMQHADLGIHAFPKAYKLFKTLEKARWTYDEKKWKGICEPFWNMSYIKGGYETRPSLFMDGAEIIGCVRYGPGVTPISIKKDLELIIGKLKAEDPGFNCEFEVSPGGIPFDISPDAHIVQVLSKSHKKIACQYPEVPRAFKVYGITDARLLHAAGIDCCIYGPGGGSGFASFTRPERVSIPELMTATKVYALSALEVCRETKTTK